jgi:hypothetical protein
MIWLQAISELFINLSAGWFGAAIIFPITSNKRKIKKLALILNIFFGIFALVIAVVIRSSV